MASFTSGSPGPDLVGGNQVIDQPEQSVSVAQVGVVFPQERLRHISLPSIVRPAFAGMLSHRQRASHVVLVEKMILNVGEACGHRTFERHHGENVRQELSS